MSTVRDYYEANTWKFLLFGSQGAIHRELWGPGVTNRAEAVHYAHELVLAELCALIPGGRGRVLDLGCGVGAAALFLAEHVPARVWGVSLSPRQVALARTRATGQRLFGSCSFHEADFCRLPRSLVEEMQPIDLAFAIEAFVHAKSADALFRAVSEVLRPKGRLVIIDDVLAAPHPVAPLVDEVRAGWLMQSLLSVSGVAAVAAPHGLTLVDHVDLSALQRLGRPRDRVVHLLQPLLRTVRSLSPWAQSLVGGDALQRCHRLGLLKYQLMRFEKNQTEGS